MLSISKFTSSYKSTSGQSGFTLIELMVVVAIIAILAAIAIPSYRRYTVLNAESQAQAKMKQLQIELETWRASSLTYKGFTPKRVASDGTATFAYDDTANTQINIPDATNPKYTITLLADATGTASLVSTSTTFSANGNRWRMLATPTSYLQGYGARKILLTSTGLSCESADSGFTIDATCNEAGATKW